MKVLFLIRSWHIGGAQTYALQMMQEFRVRGHSVGFVAGFSGGELWSQAAERTFCAEVVDRAALSLLTKTGCLGDRQSVDLLVSHLYIGDLIAYALVQRNHNIPWVSVKHMLVSRVDEGSGIDEFWDCFAANEIVERALCWYSSRIVAVSEAVAQSMVQRGVADEKIMVRPVSVVSSSPSPPRGRTDTVASGAITFGCLSRHHADKGVDVLLQACSVLRDTPGWSLRIASDGPMKQYLHNETHRLGLKTQVTFLGTVPDAFAFLRSIDILVVPSRREGHPIVVQEAASIGVPCIATSVGGLPEMISCGAGLLVPPENPEKLAAAMTELITCPKALSNLREQIGKLRLGQPLGALVEEILELYHKDATHNREA